MDKLYELINNITDTLKGDNGPTYVGIFGIVLIVCSRYGYKLKANRNGTAISIEPDISHSIDIEKIATESTIPNNLIDINS